jgi:hypothetical protein
MSWLRLAFGLVREAASTEVGQDIINDIRANAFKTREQALERTESINQVKVFLEERLSVLDRNIGMLVETLNRQHAMLVEMQKVQRVWNLVLAGGVVMAIAVAFLI